MRYLLLALILLCSLTCYSAMSKEHIPEIAYQYRESLIEHAQAHYGMNAPIPLFASQIHKESTWRYDAKSPYASGLTQFTPQTAKHVSQKYPELIANEPLNPEWAIQAMLIYDKDLKRQVDAIDECNDWAFTFAMYNGGAGWIWREKNLAEEDGVDRNQYWNAVELYNAGRREDAKRENRGYPKKIIYVLQPLYNNGEWGYSDICLKEKEPEVKKNKRLAWEF